jgi:hypothetical protein
MPAAPAAASITNGRMAMGPSWPVESAEGTSAAKRVFARHTLMPSALSGSLRTLFPEAA